MWGKNGTKTEKGGDVGRNGSPFDFQASRNYPSRTFHIPELEQSDRYDAFSFSFSFTLLSFLSSHPNEHSWPWLTAKTHEKIHGKDCVEGREKDATGLRAPKLKESITMGNGGGLEGG